MLWKMALVLILVIANGFFVAAEFALVKIRLQEIRILAREGSRAARLVESIMENLSAYLSACQLGITLASLGLGWIGEPLVARSIEPVFEVLNIPQDKVHLVAFPLAFFFITFLHITIGEQVPKILAIKKYRPTAYAVSLPLIVFYTIFKPFIWFLNTVSNFMLSAIGIQADSDHGEVITEDELRSILIESTELGHLTQRKQLIMENVLDLENKIARNYMVPRNEIVYLDKNDKLEQQLNVASDSGHTRFPICDGQLDNVEGIIHVKDIFQAYAKKQNITDISLVARKPTFLLETITLEKLFRELQNNNMVMAMLVDEYGVVSGMITIENIIEQLVGPIQDEFDQETPGIIKKGENSFEVDAACTIHEIQKKLDITFTGTTSETVGGAVTEAFEHIPEINEKIVIGDYEFTVLESDTMKVKRVLINKINSSE